MSASSAKGRARKRIEAASAPPAAAPRKLVIVVDCDADGMRGKWCVTTHEGDRDRLGAAGSWMREGRELDAPIALIATMGAGAVSRSPIRGRHGDGEAVVCEVVQSLAFELF